jgi:hypothetical protein
LRSNRSPKCPRGLWCWLRLRSRMWPVVTVRHVFEVRRPDDDELCGFVTDGAEGWLAVTVFGGLLGSHPDRDDAERQVLNDGLASMAERWTLVDSESGEEQIVCIQETNPSSVTLALDYYSLPGVPTLTLSRDDLQSGRWTLRR